jgi:STE24 endopeptidase
MTPQILFYIIISILVLDFIVDQILDALNARHFDDSLPPELQDVYEDGEYKRSQNYKKTKYRFATLTSAFSLMITLAFFFLDGFAFVNDLVAQRTDHNILTALVFFGIIMLASDILMTPFSYYSTFVIEEKFGFNNTTRKTFWLDKLKGWGMGAILGGGILALIIWFYQLVGSQFWIYAWIMVTVFTVFMNMFYSKLIVPLFNKQTPLSDGSLREKIEAYAKKVGFTLDNIYIIDGSKRSTKANAYFSGFGSEKRITLFDTLVKDLEEDEIVAVLAHEVGHYKKKHIVFNLLASVITTGLTLWLLSLCVDSALLSQALGVDQPAFHIGLIAFGVLFSPISGITGFLMNILSRKFEYQADDYAAKTYFSEKLINSLKKLSGKSLSNLTPHPLYIWAHFSHPSLLQRIRNLKEISN